MSAKSAIFKSAISKSSRIAYWLVPTKPERELFCELIRILADELNAPCFEPHLTLCVTRENAQSACRRLERVGAKPVRLCIEGLDCSTRFTKTLFVRFRRNRALDHLHASLLATEKKSASILQDPHLSLLYKRMPTTAKRDLLSGIHLPLSEVAFDSIKVVHCVSPTVTRADIESWQVVATKSLSAASNK